MPRSLSQVCLPHRAQSQNQKTIDTKGNCLLRLHRQRQQQDTMWHTEPFQDSFLRSVNTRELELVFAPITNLVVEAVGQYINTVFWFWLLLLYCGGEN